jgi:hypothetical protein
MFTKDDNHGSRSIDSVTSSPLAPDTELTSTITIDSIAKQHLKSSSSILCKLDVEGAEISAFEGAGELLDTDFAAIYEEHGKDEACTISRYLIDSAMEIYDIYDSFDIRRVHTVEQIAAKKKRKTTGYNYVALRGDGPLCGRIRKLAETK